MYDGVDRPCGGACVCVVHSVCGVVMVMGRYDATQCARHVWKALVWWRVRDALLGGGMVLAVHAAV